jgi:AcrR family transcriptional regulator
MAPPDCGSPSRFPYYRSGNDDVRVTPMARPNKSERTREQIVERAIALIDRDGMEAVSVRRLASELGIRGPTLYHYFANKNALLDAVRTRLVAELWAEVERRLDHVATDDWANVLRGYVEGALDVVGRHPRAVEFLALRPVSGPRSFRGYELMLDRLTACGWPVSFAWHVFIAAENLMLSAALEQGAPTFAPALDKLEDFPLVQQVALDIRRDPELDDGYPTGLEAFIHGVAVLAQDARRGGASPRR